MKKAIVVLQVLPALEMGGVERGTIEIAAALQQEGIKNYVVSSGGPMVRELEKLGVEHITLPVQSKNPFVMWRNVKRLAAVVKEKKVTVMHVRSRAPAWSVQAVSKRTGVPFIATYHGAYRTKPEWLKKPYNRVMTKGVKTIAVSDFIKQHIIDNYGVDPSRIVTIFRGADIRRFNPERVLQERVTELIKAYQLPPEKPVITLPGRLSKIKGHGYLLDALKMMKNKEVTCLFVGSDQGRVEYTASLQEQIKELAPETTVQLVKSCSDMPALYLLSDVVVNTSMVPESFGRTVVEAQAMGRPVVAFAHGGACETIEDGKTGYLVPVGDSKALADALDKILSASALERKKMRVASIESVRKNFSVQSMCAATIALYKEVSK